MDHLLECLECVVDSSGREDYEVEYSVRAFNPYSSLS